MTDFAKIERHARALMTAHGVGSLGFEFDRAKKRIGATHFVNVGGDRWLAKKITLSQHYAALLSEDEIRETILHEIAHAKAGRCKGDAHGPAFKREARALGISGDRCKAVSQRPDYLWEGFCPSCGERRYGLQRVPKKVYLCADVSCLSIPRHKRMLNWKKKGVYGPAQDMPGEFYRVWNQAMSKKVV